jgi:predicted acetyltransferase
MALVWPARTYLASYAAALERGWSPDNIRGAAAAREQLAKIAVDPDAFVASLVDREAKGIRSRSMTARTCRDCLATRSGSGTASSAAASRTLAARHPPYCLGHVGYSVVPWKRRRGYATAALREILPDLAAEGLRYVEVTTDPDNIPSRRGDRANGGVLVETFTRLAALGGTPGQRYRINVGTLEDPS